MKKTVAVYLLFLAILCTACGQQEVPTGPEEAAAPEEQGEAVTPEEQGESIEPEEQGEAAGYNKTDGTANGAWTDELGDRLLMRQVAGLSNGQLLLLDTYGKRTSENTYGVREVRVYDDEDLIQTIPVREAIESVWGAGDGALRDEFYDYTECPSLEDTITVLDLNFDGNKDFGLFGWTPSNTIPYYYWIWDPAEQQYQFAFVLQGVETHPEEQEISSEYKEDTAHYITAYYKPDKTGSFYLDRVEVLGYESEEESYELWTPGPEQKITPADSEWSYTDLTLTSRERPKQEILADQLESVDVRLGPPEED